MKLSTDWCFLLGISSWIEIAVADAIPMKEGPRKPVALIVISPLGDLSPSHPLEIATAPKNCKSTVVILLLAQCNLKIKEFYQII